MGRRRPLEHTRDPLLPCFPHIGVARVWSVHLQRQPPVYTADVYIRIVFRVLCTGRTMAPPGRNAPCCVHTRSSSSGGRTTDWPSRAPLEPGVGAKGPLRLLALCRVGQPTYPEQSSLSSLGIESDRTSSSRSSARQTASPPRRRPGPAASFHDSSHSSRGGSLSCSPVQGSAVISP